MSENEKNETQKELKQGDAPEKPQQLTPKQIFDAYPNDKEKAINYLLLGVQTDLNRIANTLEYLARRKQLKDPIPGLDSSPADAPPKKE